MDINSCKLIKFHIKNMFKNLIFQFGEENVEKSTRYWTDGVFVQSSVDSVFYLVESKGPTSIQISVPPNPHGARYKIK